jgi:hypothetical protein
MGLFPGHSLLFEICPKRVTSHLRMVAERVKWVSTVNEVAVRLPCRWSRPVVLRAQLLEAGEQLALLIHFGCRTLLLADRARCVFSRQCPASLGSWSCLLLPRLPTLN